MWADNQLRGARRHAALMDRSGVRPLALRRKGALASPSRWPRRGVGSGDGVFASDYTPS